MPPLVEVDEHFVATSKHFAHVFHFAYEFEDFVRPRSRIRKRRSATGVCPDFARFRPKDLAESPKAKRATDFGLTKQQKGRRRRRRRRRVANESGRWPTGPESVDPIEVRGRCSSVCPIAYEWTNCLKIKWLELGDEKSRNKFPPETMKLLDF